MECGDGLIYQSATDFEYSIILSQTVPGCRSQSRTVTAGVGQAASEIITSLPMETAAAGSAAAGSGQAA